MKLAHISDLHLGKTLNEFSLIEDQKYILNQIIEICKKQKIDILLIAGDVYDKSVASIEGIKLFETFLKNLVDSKIKVCVISGNHDSSERLTFGADFMTSSGIFFSRPYTGKVESLTFSDAFGELNIYLLPFIRLYEVKHFHPDENINSYDDAVSCAIKNMNVDFSKRNIIMCHQNILNAEHCESEEAVIGGLDAISANVFDGFDYVALGHIHKQQKIKDNIYYCGTPLKYSVSERNDDKSILIIELNEKQNINITSEKLTPLKDVREISGKFEEIIENSKNDPYNKNDYISIVLNDENEVLDVLSVLRRVYPNVLSMKYQKETLHSQTLAEETVVENLNKPLDLFEEFYKQRVGNPLTDEQKKIMSALIEKTWREE